MDTIKFPSSVIVNVEYSVKFYNIYCVDLSQIDCIFSDESVVQRKSVYIENNIPVLSFLITKEGSYTFNVLFNGEIIYKNDFSSVELYTNVTKNIDVCSFQHPKNSTIEIRNDEIHFTYPEYTEWEEYPRNDESDNLYCGIRYYAPNGATHWRVVLCTDNKIVDSEKVEFLYSDYGSVEWYFPIAYLLSDRYFTYRDKQFKQQIYFYKKINSDFVELFSKEYTFFIHKNEKNLNIDEWNEEVLKLIELIKEGCQIKDLIRKYGSWHSMSEKEIRSNIRKYKDNFGEFALCHGLIKTHNQCKLLNYATHYTLIDSIIKLGVTDLKQTREDFQDLMFQAKRGIVEVLPRIQ